MTNKQLRIKIGPVINEDFQVFLGEEDITEKLCVTGVRMNADADSGLLSVTMDIFADCVEILPSEVVVRIEDKWPRRKSWLQRFWAWLV